MACLKLTTLPRRIANSLYYLFGLLLFAFDNGGQGKSCYFGDFQLFSVLLRVLKQAPLITKCSGGPSSGPRPTICLYVIHVLSVIGFHLQE